MIQEFKDILKLNLQLRKEVLLQSFKFCNPPLKGKITMGKIKWRKLIQCQQGNRYWIEQRGKRVSPILEENKIVLSSYKDLISDTLSEEEINKELIKIKSA